MDPAITYAREVTERVVRDYTREEQRHFHALVRERPMFVRKLIYDSIVYWRRLYVDRYRELRRAVGRARRAADIAKQVGNRIERVASERRYDAYRKKISAPGYTPSNEELVNIAIALNFLLISNGTPTLRY